MKNILKKATPYILSVAGFIIVCAVCFAPQFSGKSLVQHDYIQYQGMSKDIAEDP